MTRPIFRTRDIERFTQHISSGGPDECWPWTSVTVRRGYGRWVVERDGKRTRYAAHRLAWQIANGPVPDGLSVCHRCDSPPCCNPSHLFLGTTADNLADMRSKGRGPTGDLSGPRKHPDRYQGEQNGRAKLTAADVREIRHNSLGLTDQVLADAHGVSQSAIRFARIGATWKSVT